MARWWWHLGGCAHGLLFAERELELFGELLHGFHAGGGGGAFVFGGSFATRTDDGPLKGSRRGLGFGLECLFFLGLLFFDGVGFV